MTMSFKNLDTFAEKQKAFADIVKSGGDAEAQGKAFGEMMDALSTDLNSFQEKLKNKTQEEIDNIVAANTGDVKMTQDEVKFFNDISTDTGFKNDQLIPQTTVDKIFEDMTSNHPLLQAIGLQNNGVRLKIWKSDAKGAAVWGKIFGNIQGQLDATFTSVDAEMSKLTAFVVLPNDLDSFGPAWVRTYVITQITEAFAAAAESAFVDGDGNSKPIGLDRDPSKGATSVGVTTYPVKADAGTVTLKDADTAKFELMTIIKALSKNAKGKPVVARGNTILVVQPGASLDFERAMTMQNVNGQWVYALPYGIQIIESQYVPDGKAIAFVKGRYDAYMAGGLNISDFNQTLAIQDAILFTAKQFFYGAPADSNAALVYALNIAAPSASTTGGLGK
ncbi:MULTISPECIES: phage major capsid protein [Lacticaseibacillus]|uniref:Phage major head protein n=1 Tax=Lacticaseibacillus casei DSM 20011 = JCM 1134 = ATCC 393 TaxID=1423732 RepID=A0AAD1AN32_LACCA|nr:phage major capsid protein [Lacticaseibacillus casei]MBI6598861.1 phage major capsid protein [Lacticaseibacillus casei]MBO1482531.1 phage major capsid protein [Lacticaseibacillus casei]MBO2417816.1 phage major capsid protein [Lacticaseibacillus casei]MCK2082195.1 phage major capsid protein [Lacticaseibacillus casei]MED7631939.1 phage major capsid protein [Lacticaseibacillus casei]